MRWILEIFILSLKILFEKEESSNTDNSTEDIENEIKEAIQQKEEEIEFKASEGKIAF